MAGVRLSMTYVRQDLQDFSGLTCKSCLNHLSSITCAMACSVVCDIDKCTAVAPNFSNTASTSPLKIKKGAPLSRAATSTSCQLIPPRHPVCNAFNAASFAAKRAA